MARKVELNGLTFYEPRLRWKSGRAYARFYEPNMRPKQKDFALHTSDKDEAEALFQRRRQEYFHGKLDPWNDRRVDGYTLDEALEEYLYQQDVRLSTLKSKRVRLEPFVREYPGMLVSGITENMIRGYCFRSDLAIRTQKRYVYELRHFISFCQEMGWIPVNPAAEVIKNMPRRKTKTKRKITEYLTNEEVPHLISVVRRDIEKNPRRADRTVLIEVIHFGVLTGLRRGEICRLRWEDVHLFDPPKTNGTGVPQYGWIHVRSREGEETKTGHEASVPIAPPTAELLKRNRPGGIPRGYVFPAPRTGGKLDGEWISKIFRYYRRKAGIREGITFHSLRHTCASWLAERGVGLPTIKEMLRHSHIKQSERYSHLSPDVISSKVTTAFGDIEL